MLQFICCTYNCFDVFNCLSKIKLAVFSSNVSYSTVSTQKIAKCLYPQFIIKFIATIIIIKLSQVLLEFTNKDILTREYHPVCVIPKSSYYYSKNECSIRKSQQNKSDTVLMITSSPYWNMIYDRYVYHISIHTFESLSVYHLLELIKAVFMNYFFTMLYMFHYLMILIVIYKLQVHSCR